MDALTAKRHGIADRIKAILAEKSWSQNKLAETAGISRSYITRILRVKDGESPPTIATIVKLETALEAIILEAARSPNSEQTGTDSE